MDIVSIFRKRKHRGGPAVLTQGQRRFWKEKGFLILENFFDVTDLNKFLQDIARLWEQRKRADNPLVVDVLEGPLTGRRLKFREVPDEVRVLSHKLNDLYLVSASCRHLALNAELCEILSGLLEGDPIIINSLTFEKGSQQGYHFDTYYMSPPRRNRMVVSSICLEDHSEESGPLTYYPGSHNIAPYVFSHGGLRATDDEMQRAKAYIELELDKRGMKPETFIGKSGDVFLWHAQLYHGGRPISNPLRTRRSLVTHYWCAEDVKPSQIGSIGPRQFYLLRPHQKVNS